MISSLLSFDNFLLFWPGQVNQNGVGPAHFFYYQSVIKLSLNANKLNHTQD